ncbi:hypothetical protein BKA70DRAFT_1559821 [Coprinopsis sp. MPI-PUGE-AT-0042]|nr:hypothetical protein BKA70DRAFT_1559821 [Coprinopsis sp. MPI-PUGE-AT-0042]
MTGMGIRIPKTFLHSKALRDQSRRQEAQHVLQQANPAFTPLRASQQSLPFVDGRPVEDEDDWTCRRQEISTLLQRLELGTLPPAPTSLTASLSALPSLSTCPAAMQPLHLWPPSSILREMAHSKRLIGIGGSTLPQPRGIATITFNNREIAFDSGPAGRGQGKFYDLYGVYLLRLERLLPGPGVVSRIIDALSKTTNSRIDLDHIAVTGCSTNGKAALVAGALDERIALTIPVESGVGGAACWRPSQDLRDGGAGIIYAFDLANTHHLFTTAFNSYATRVNTLPFDHHLLAAVVAPRGLLVLDNSQFAWLGPSSVFGLHEVEQRCV